MCKNYVVHIYYIYIMNAFIMMKSNLKVYNLLCLFKTFGVFLDRWTPAWWEE